MPAVTYIDLTGDEAVEVIDLTMDTDDEEDQDGALEVFQESPISFSPAGSPRSPTYHPHAQENEGRDYPALPQSPQYRPFQDREPTPFPVGAQQSPPPVPPQATGPECGVCWQLLDNGVEERSLWMGKCGHVYCKTCLHRAERESKKCPTCRSSLNKKSMRQVFI